MAVQDGRRQAHESIPEGRFRTRGRAPLKAHHGHALPEMQQGPEQAEPGQHPGYGIDGTGGAARGDLMGDEAERQGRQQLDQPAGKPGGHQPGDVRRRAVQGQTKQVPGLDLAVWQRAAEHPRLLAKRLGLLFVHANGALADRVNFAVAPEHTRQQSHGLTVLFAKSQHRMAVGAPPCILVLKTQAPWANPGGIQHIDQAGRRLRGTGARGNLEINTFMAADEVQGID